MERSDAALASKSMRLMIIKKKSLMLVKLVLETFQNTLSQISSFSGVYVP